MPEHVEYKPSSTLLNAEPQPRILLHFSSSKLRDAFAFVNDYSGTARVLRYTGDVRQGDWDVVITDQRPSVLDGSRNWRGFDSHLHVIYVLPAEADGGDGRGVDYIEGDDQKQLGQVFVTRNVPGALAQPISGLPDELASLARRRLGKLVASRRRQFGVEFHWFTNDAPPRAELRPFLLSPDGLVFAASYSRAPGASAWILPGDLDDFKPWVDLAFREWHEADSEKFPSDPAWTESDAWRTLEEIDAAGDLADAEAAFEKHRAQYEAEREQLSLALEVAREHAAKGERRLVFDQGVPLQDAARDALRALGFTVEDMDLVWDAREPREDYRITDAAEAGWLAIGDATGVKGGVPGAKLVTLGRYAQKFVLEEKPSSLPDQWLVVNHRIAEDPNVRGELIRKDEVRSFAASDGLVLATPALFLLLQHVKANPGSKAELRAHLRQSRGGFGLAEARAWIATQHGHESSDGEA